MHLSCSFAKILRETNFQPRELPWSGSKAKYVKERKKRENRAKVGNNNGQLHIANATSGGARKPPEPTKFHSWYCIKWLGQYNLYKNSSYWDLLFSTQGHQNRAFFFWQAVPCFLTIITMKLASNENNFFIPLRK